MKWDLDLWYELWDRAGSQGLDTWYELRGEDGDGRACDPAAKANGSDPIGPLSARSPESAAKTEF
jgi:hypothetical protein